MIGSKEWWKVAKPVANAYFAKYENRNKVKMGKYENAKFNRALAKDHPSNEGVLSILRDKEGKLYAISHELIGQGGFGRVKRIYNENGDSFVVKIQANANLAGKEPILDIMKLIGLLKSEVATMGRPPKFFLGQVVDDKHYSIMTQIKGDELTKKLYEVDANNQLIVDPYTNDYISRANITRVQKLILAIKCCQAIKQLQDEYRIIHGDIKVENFVANIHANQIEASAIDFEQAAILPEGEEFVFTPIPATPLFAAPEVYDIHTFTYHGQFSFQSDIYSLGRMIENDLGLEPELYEAMLAVDPIDRPSLNKVILKLAKALGEEPNLDADAKQVLSEVYDPQHLLDYVNNIKYHFSWEELRENVLSESDVNQDNFIEHAQSLINSYVTLEEYKAELEFVNHPDKKTLIKELKYYYHHVFLELLENENKQIQEQNQNKKTLINNIVRAAILNEEDNNLAGQLNKILTEKNLQGKKVIGNNSAAQFVADPTDFLTGLGKLKKNTAHHSNQPVDPLMQLESLINNEKSKFKRNQEEQSKNLQLLKKVADTIEAYHANKKQGTFKVPVGKTLPLKGHKKNGAFVSNDEVQETFNHLANVRTAQANAELDEIRKREEQAVEARMMREKEEAEKLEQLVKQIAKIESDANHLATLIDDLESSSYHAIKTQLQAIDEVLNHIQYDAALVGYYYDNDVKEAVADVKQFIQENALENCVFTEGACLLTEEAKSALVAEQQKLHQLLGSQKPVTNIPLAHHLLHKTVHLEPMTLVLEQKKQTIQASQKPNVNKAPSHRVPSLRISHAVNISQKPNFVGVSSTIQVKDLRETLKITRDTVAKQTANANVEHTNALLADQMIGLIVPDLARTNLFYHQDLLKKNLCELLDEKTPTVDEVANNLFQTARGVCNGVQMRKMNGLLNSKKGNLEACLGAHYSGSQQFKRSHHSLRETLIATRNLGVSQAVNANINDQENRFTGVDKQALEDKIMASITQAPGYEYTKLVTMQPSLRESIRVLLERNARPTTDDIANTVIQTAARVCSGVQLRKIKPLIEQTKPKFEQCLNNNAYSPLRI